MQRVAGDVEKNISHCGRHPLVWRSLVLSAMAKQARLQVGAAMLRFVTLASSHFQNH